MSHATGRDTVEAAPRTDTRRGTRARRAVDGAVAGAGALGRRLDRTLDRRLGGPARKRIIILLAAVLALNGANSGAIGAMAVQLEHSLHIDDTWLGLLVTTSSIAGAVVTVPFGMLADRMTRRGLLLGGLAVWTCACLASASAGSFAGLIGLQLVVGAAAAVAGPSVASLTGDFFTASERGSVYGYILTGELVGAGFGIVVAGDLGAAVGWRGGLVLLGLAGLVLTWLVFRFLPEPPAAGRPVRPATGRVATPARSRERGPGRTRNWSAGSRTRDSSRPGVRRPSGVPNTWTSSPPPATSSVSARTSC